MVQSRNPTPTHVTPDVRTPLIAWFSEYGRDLPWRRTRDPWTILVSEFMLQQTSVDRVLDRLPGFLQAFPTARACAGVPLGEVLRAWSGLGYNRRARNLHRTAQIICDEYGGKVPRDLAELRGLPGVGAYTARAVRVFAHEETDAVLDTNIGRVLARLHDQRLSPARAQALAGALVPAGRAWVWNQALMELGALVCRARPECGRCPIREHCRWAEAGRPDPDPAHRSAGVSTGQPPFDGSDRQGRGRLLRKLTHGSLPTDSSGEVMGWPADPSRVRRVVVDLITEGLIIEIDGELRLP
jgi:A/G-specific adenine glycosylase